MRDKLAALLDEAQTLVAQDPAAAAIAGPIRLARRALDAKRADPEDYLTVGQQLEDEGRFEMAAEYYEEAVTVDPSSARAWTNLGEARRRLSRWPEALRAYDEALRQQPAYLWALAGRGEALRMLGRAEEAIGPFSRALERAPEHVFAVQGLAATLTELGRFR